VTPEPTSTSEPTLAPTGGAPDEEDLVDGNRGTIDAPDSAPQGSGISVQLDPALAGDTVHVWLFSTPTDLGEAIVGADGSIAVRIPASVPAGDHRLVVTDADGEIIAWTEIEVTAAQLPDSGLPATGGDARWQPLTVIGSLLALAIGAALLRRARRLTD